MKLANKIFHFYVILLFKFRFSNKVKVENFENFFLIDFEKVNLDLDIYMIGFWLLKKLAPKMFLECKKFQFIGAKVQSS